MDEDERFLAGSVDTYARAVAACEARVDAFLLSHCEPAMTADALYTAYKSFGEDPFIVPEPPGEHFSAWTYARRRCDELCPAATGRRGEPEC
jgi:hypothetical protein